MMYNYATVLLMMYKHSGYDGEAFVGRTMFSVLMVVLTFMVPYMARVYKLHTFLTLLTPATYQTVAQWKNSSKTLTMSFAHHAFVHHALIQKCQKKC